MSTKCLDGYPQYSTLHFSAAISSPQQAALSTSLLASILDNAGPTVVTNLAGDVLYANQASLSLFERDYTHPVFTKSNRDGNRHPTSSSSSLLPPPYHYTQLFEPANAINADSIRNHLTGLTTLGMFFQKQNTVSRNVECLTARSRRSIHLRLSTRMLATTSLELPTPSQTPSVSQRTFTTQTPPLSPPTSASYSTNTRTTAAPSNKTYNNNHHHHHRHDNIHMTVPTPKYTLSTPPTTPTKHHPLPSPPAPFLLITTVTDLTDANFASLVHSTHDRRLSLAYNSEGIIVEASQSCIPILGYTPDELLGSWGYDHVHPDDVLEVREKHARHLGEHIIYRMRKKDGSYAWLDMRSSDVFSSGPFIFVGFDVTEEKNREMEMRNGLLAKIKEDGINREEGENAEAQSKANKYVGFICHELRNPLNGIIGFNSLLLDTPNLSETQLEYAEGIATISQHMCNLLNQTLDLCQTQQPNPVGLDATHSIGGADSPSNNSRPASPRNFATPSTNCRLLHLRKAVEFGFVTVSVAARAKRTELRFHDEITPMLVGLANSKAGVSTPVDCHNHHTSNGNLKIITADVKPRHVYGEEDSVRKIILNYLTNAIKYTPAGGVVTAHLTVESPSLPPVLGAYRGFTARCAISDTGPGIPAKDLRRLFLPYSKLIRSCVNDEPIPAACGGSSGLGLSICKELADKIGGKVGVDSVPGGGSTFWVTFPVYYDLPEGCSADDEDDQASCDCVGTNACVGSPSVCSPYAGSVTLEVESHSQSHSHSQSQSQSPPRCPSSPRVAPRKQRSRPAKVLMVEDNDINQRVALKYLEKLGEEVTVASDGAEALEKMKNEKFDILFVDLQMPVMDGYTFTRHVRAAEEERALAKVQAALEVQRHPSADLFALPRSASNSSSCSSNSLGSPASEVSSFSVRRSSATSSASSSSTPSPEPSPPVSLQHQIHDHSSILLGATPVPIVACTGNVLEKDRSLCKQLGMNGFLSKPYKMTEMKALIDELVTEVEDLNITSRPSA